MFGSQSDDNEQRNQKPAASSLWSNPGFTFKPCSNAADSTSATNIDYKNNNNQKSSSSKEAKPSSKDVQFHFVLKNAENFEENDEELNNKSENKDFPPVCSDSSNDPRRVLCHPHFIQKICKYINIRYNPAKACLLSHINQSWEDTLYFYSTLHTTFLTNFFDWYNDPPVFRSVSMFGTPVDSSTATPIVRLLRRLKSSSVFSLNLDPAALRLQRLLFDAFLPYHDRVPSFWYCRDSSSYAIATSLFDLEPLQMLLNSLVLSLLRKRMEDRTTDMLFVQESSWWIQRRTMQEKQRKFLAKCAAPPQSFILFRLGQAYFEHHGAEWKTISWNPIVEAIRADDVEAFEAFVTAAAIFTLRQEIIDAEARRKAAAEEPIPDANELEFTTILHPHKRSYFLLLQHDLEFDEEQIECKKCEIVSDIFLETGYNFIRYAWRLLHNDESVRTDVTNQIRNSDWKSHFTALRVASICGSLNIFKHLRLQYKNAIASSEPSSSSLLCSLCESAVELVQIAGLDPKRRVGNYSLDGTGREADVPDRFFFVSPRRIENRREILKLVITDLLQHCLINVVEKESSSAEKVFKLSKALMTVSANDSYLTRLHSSTPEHDTEGHLLLRTLRACLNHTMTTHSPETGMQFREIICDAMIEFGGVNLLHKLLFESVLLPNTNSDDNNNIIDENQFASFNESSSSSMLISFLNTKLFHEDFSSSIFFSHLHKYLQEDPSFILANLDRHSADVSPLWCLFGDADKAGSPFAVKTFEFLVNKTNAKNVFALKRIRLDWVSNESVPPDGEKITLLHRIVTLRFKSKPSTSVADLIRSLLNFIIFQHGSDRLQVFLERRTEFQQKTAFHWCFEFSNKSAARVLVNEFGANSNFDYN